MKIKTLRFSQKPVQKTKQDKQVKVRLEKADYVKLLGEAEEWPLSLRIAAELYRSGVRGDQFEKQFHLEGNSYSQRVYEYFAQMDLGRGANPDRVPPVRPVYLRYVSPTQAKEQELLEGRGRPSKEEAVKFIRRLIERQKERGWRESDFIVALRTIDEDEEPVMRIQSQEEEPKPVTKVRKIRTYTAFIDGKWVEAQNKATIERQLAAALAKAQASEKALLPLDKLATHCIWCKEPLHGTIVSTPHGKIESMHIGCYYRNEVPEADLVTGFKILDPKSGNFYVWEGMPDIKKGTGGWQPAKKVRDEKVNTGTTEPTIPGTQGEKSESAKTVSDKKSEGGAVQQMPKASS